MNRVLVIGSINMDLVVSAERFPGPGETILGNAFSTFPGGKGANQAVAARRLGAQVSMIGCVGRDAFGVELVDTLAREGIDTRHIRVSADVATGVAAITLSASENSIVVVPGANHAITLEQLETAEEAFQTADVVLCQLEIPLEIVEAAAAMAARFGKPFLLNPAPAQVLPEKLLAQTTLLTPNEHELALIFGTPADAWQSTLARHPERVLMTRGADGAWFADPKGEAVHCPAFAVEAIDTTGAGDTFNGALAACWGRELRELVRLACGASALSVTRKGAQSGMPTHDQLAAFLASQEDRPRIQTSPESHH